MLLLTASKILILKSLLHIIRLALTLMIQIIIKITHTEITLRLAELVIQIWRRTIATLATWAIRVHLKEISQTCHHLFPWEELQSHLHKVWTLLVVLSHIHIFPLNRIKGQMMKMFLHHKRAVTQFHLKVCLLLHQWWTNLLLPLTTCILQVAAQSKGWIAVGVKMVLLERKPDSLLIDPNRRQSEARKISRHSGSGSLA